MEEGKRKGLFGIKLVCLIKFCYFLASRMGRAGSIAPTPQTVSIITEGWMHESAEHFPPSGKVIFQP